VSPDFLNPPFATVAALVPDGAGGFRTYVGAINASGTYTIPGVPTGTYVLVLSDGAGVLHAVETTASTVDLGYDVLGRQNLAPATLSTPVTFNLTGLTRGTTNEIQIASGSADLADVVPNQPANNQTTATFAENWLTSSIGRPLDLVAAGDPLHVYQLASYSVNGTTRVAFAYSRASNGAVTSTATINNGQPVTIGPLTLATRGTGNLSPVTWNITTFQGLTTSMGPGATAAVANTHVLAVEAAPYAQASTIPLPANGVLQLLRMVRTNNANVSITNAVNWGRVLEDTLWSEWRRATYTANVSYTAPGASAALVVPATVTRRDPLWATSPYPTIDPAVSPVRTPTVAGANALGTIPATGLTPRIAWTAPATGAPTSYRVSLYRLFANGTASASQRVATWIVGGTSVNVPANVLVSGQTYYAEIVAQVRGASDIYATAPERNPALASTATTLTSPFSP
jgi:hypothetical protein